MRVGFILLKMKNQILFIIIFVLFAGYQAISQNTFEQIISNSADQKINQIIEDYDGNFVRMVTVALCKVLGTKIRWINRWSDGKKVRVLIPFYTPFAGQERFILDAFVDDTASTRVELNTDQRQRGIVTFKGGSQRDDEFANPNQYLAKEIAQVQT